MNTACIRGPTSWSSPYKETRKTLRSCCSLKVLIFQVQYSMYLLIITPYPGLTQLVNKHMKVTNLTDNWWTELYNFIEKLFLPTMLEGGNSLVTEKMESEGDISIYKDDQGIRTMLPSPDLEILFQLSFFWNKTGRHNLMYKKPNCRNVFNIFSNFLWYQSHYRELTKKFCHSHTMY